MPHFVTAEEALAGRPYEHAQYHSAELLLQPMPERAAQAPGDADSLRTAGYWHWDGLDYVWIESSSEPANPAFLWQWRADRRVR